MNNVASFQRNDSTGIEEREIIRLPFGQNEFFMIHLQLVSIFSVFGNMIVDENTYFLYKTI